MARAINPAAGVRDQLGTPQKVWEKGYFKLAFDDQNRPYLVAPIDASVIGSGLLNPDRIESLNTGVVVGPAGPTLEAILIAAALGAGDPAARINTGGTPVSGEKIQDGTLNPSAFDPLEKLLQNFLVGDAGVIESDDYNGTDTGFKLSKTELKIFLATAIFHGILTGKIQISQFIVDATGKAIWRNPAIAPAGMTVEADGRAYWGSDAYPDAPLQMDAQGNIYVSDTLVSLSRIDLGAISAVCKGVQPSQAGGQFSGNLTLTPLTRGAAIYYTTDGSDPSNVTNANRTLYTVPFLVDTTSGNVTVKAMAIKLGISSAVQSWTFTTSASVVAAPTFDPLPGFFAIPATTLPVTLSSGTIGATIIYTLDGTTPSDSNGATYVGPILVPRQTNPTTIKAFAKKAGLTPSAVVSGFYIVNVGTGGGGGGGHSSGQ